MSLDGCLSALRASGEVSNDEADAIRVMYEALLRHYGEPNAAKAELVARLMRQAEQQQREAGLFAAARDRNEGFLLAYRNRNGEQDPAEALIALIEHNGQMTYRLPPGASSVVGRANAIKGMALGSLEGLLHEFRRTWVSGATRNRARLLNVVREAAGEGTGDQAAADFARAWRETAEALRQRANAAGAAIQELQGWFLPQHHDRLALLRGGRERWMADMLGTPERPGWLDPAMHRHPLTGNAMTRADLEQSLGWIYDEITSDGWQSRQPQARRGNGGRLNYVGERAAHRFLHFRDAEAWLAYQAAYGGGADPFAAMMKHVEGMAEDIAAMEIFGPRPDAMLTYLQQAVMRQAALRRAGQPSIFPTETSVMGRSFEEDGSWIATRNPEDYARGAIRLSQDMWDMYKGTADAVTNQRVADSFDTIRNLNVAALLGSAAVSAVTDLGYQQVARQFAGLPALRVYGDMLTAFRQGPKRDAVRAGLILDTAMNVLQTQARWAGGTHGPVWSRYLADRVIAYSGLSAWTQAGKHAWGLAFMGELAERTGQDFAQLPDPLRRSFERYGMDARDWDALRLGADGQPRMVEFLRPTDMRQAGLGTIADRYLEMILQEGEHAVPSGTLQARARAYGGLRRGVLFDEIRRSGQQFKLFGISTVLLQGQRMATEAVERGRWRGVGFAATLLISTTLFGGLAMQLKAIKNGKDPEPMDGENFWPFWARALIQGGGMGIYGDFIVSSQSRTGGGVAETLAGPTAGTAAALLAMGFGNAGELIRGEKTNAGREGVRLLNSIVPGSSLWYVSLAYRRVLLEELQRQVDPEAQAAFNRSVQKQAKDYGNGFWWRPGDRAPDRAPDLSGALGGN